MLFAFILFLLSFFYMIRLFLIVIGMYKGPVLETFEEYGEVDPIYYPWPNFLALMGVLMIVGGFLLQRVLGSAVLANILGVLSIMVAFGLQYWKQPLQCYASKLHMPLIPIWYDKLCDETSRYERRRIAYMWLHLPLRTRLLYNGSDRLFFQWAELVIMSTVRDS